MGGTQGIVNGHGLRSASNISGRWVGRRSNGRGVNRRSGKEGEPCKGGGVGGVFERTDVDINQAEQCRDPCAPGGLMDHFPSEGFVISTSVGAANPDAIKSGGDSAENRQERESEDGLGLRFSIRHVRRKRRSKALRKCARNRKPYAEEKQRPGFPRCFRETIRR